MARVLPACKAFRPVDLTLALVAACIAAATVVMACGGVEVLTGRPVQFYGDSVFHYALARMVLDGGWTWHTPRLGAPGGCDFLSFGLDMPVESALVWLLSWTTDDCIALLNRTWILLCGLAAANAYAAFRLLGLSRSVSLACGCLYAATPYVYFRSVSHFNVHVAFVPLPTAAAVLVLSDRLRTLSVGAWGGVLGACLLVGLGFIYYSFFTSLLLVHAILIAWLTGRRGSIARGVACLLVIVGGASINLAPVAIDWARNGKPAELSDRLPQHADMFGLRVRDLVVPSAFTPVPGLRELGARNERVAWPNNGESRFAKFGVLGAIGFVISLWVLAGVRPPGHSRHEDIVRAAATGTLVLVLVGTVGGFGSMFNTYVSPTIRCYNRVFPLLSVLALVTLGSLVESVADRLPNRLLRGAMPLALLVFGMVEQNAAWFIRHEARGYREERGRLEEFVRTVEADARPGAAVYMLPATPFPHDGGHGTMRPYDHLKAFLFSRRLRWSWPVFGTRQREFVASLGPVDGPEFVMRLREAGFDYAWIDRHGADAAGNEEAVVAGGARLVHTDGSGRFGFYSLAEAGHEP